MDDPLGHKVGEARSEAGSDILHGADHKRTESIRDAVPPGLNVECFRVRRQRGKNQSRWRKALHREGASTQSVV